MSSDSFLPKALQLMWVFLVCFFGLFENVIRTETSVSVSDLEDFRKGVLRDCHTLPTSRIHDGPLGEDSNTFSIS